MDRIALNNIKDKGFDSQAQVRLLLLRAREYPERYKWVYKALKDHGLPSTEGPLKTYWEEPYNVSPTTPSYKYISPKYKKANLIKISIIKLAQKYNNPTLIKLAEVMQHSIYKKYYIDYELVKKIANQFWTIVEEKSVKDQQAYAMKLFNKLENFQPFKNLNSTMQTAVINEISSKIKGD